MTNTAVHPDDPSNQQLQASLRQATQQGVVLTLVKTANVYIW
jgi:hypothetical protein